VIASRQAIVFGGYGAIGTAVAQHLAHDGCDVVRTGRSGEGVQIDPFSEAGLSGLEGLGPFDVAVWAQGANTNDVLGELDLVRHEEVIRANVTFVSATLDQLLRSDALAYGARLCVIGSVWQLLVRQSKYSYSVSKAAVTGLVRAAAVDLAARGMLVNGVLPGVVDTPMTRAMLSPGQRTDVSAATGHDRLVQLEDVAAAVAFLCSPANGAITGQLLAVDLGFSAGRRV
jgi:3-oxoacyl-[acyl-carrier protein] reductase